MKEKNFEGIFSIVALAAGLGIGALFSLFLPSNTTGTVISVIIAVVCAVCLRFFFAKKFKGYGLKK